MKKIIYPVLLLLSCSIAFVSCKQAITPKPHGYIRIDMPEKNYQKFDAPGYPYTFEYPAFGQVVPDTVSRGWEPYWINIQFPKYQATLHISYKKVNKNLPVIINDTYNFVYRHVIKADAIVETPIMNKEKKKLRVAVRDRRPGSFHRSVLCNRQYGKFPAWSAVLQRHTQPRFIKPVYRFFYGRY